MSLYDPVCGANGPGGECRREIGHTEQDNGGYPFRQFGNDHWSWDTDHFEHWHNEWRPEEDVHHDIIKFLADVTPAQVLKAYRASLNDYDRSVLDEALKS